MIARGEVLLPASNCVNIRKSGYGVQRSERGRGGVDQPWVDASPLKRVHVSFVKTNKNAQIFMLRSKRVMVEYSN